MPKISTVNKFIKVYHGYGHKHDLLIYGHLFAGKPISRKRYSANALVNLWQLIRLFLVRPLPAKTVHLRWNNQLLKQRTENDGFIKFEWTSETEVPAGWHEVTIEHKALDKHVEATGSLYVPHITQYGFISDIDDTIMISYSKTIIKRLAALFTKNPHTRGIFEDVDKHYNMLASSHTTPDAPNPFFYVSSSEWNLYDYLVDVFSHNNLPNGAFLLNQVKRWYQLFATGKTKHGGKLIRIARVLDTFTNQQFILMGDNTQQDPMIYAQIAEKYPDRIFAIYIRNAYHQNEVETKIFLDRLTQATGVHTCLFTHSRDAIEHSRQTGLITGI